MWAQKNRPKSAGEGNKIHYHPFFTSETIAVVSESTLWCVGTSVSTGGKDKCWFHITELETVTPLPGDEHQPPAPTCTTPFIALNSKGESGQSQRCSCSLESLSHNASNPSGSEEIPLWWSAQTQLLLPEDVWWQPMAWICKAYTASIQLTKEQSSHKSFFLPQ